MSYFSWLRKNYWFGIGHIIFFASILLVLIMERGISFSDLLILFSEGMYLLFLLSALVYTFTKQDKRADWYLIVIVGTIIFALVSIPAAGALAFLGGLFFVGIPLLLNTHEVVGYIASALYTIGGVIVLWWQYRSVHISTKRVILIAMLILILLGYFGCVYNGMSIM